MNGFTSVVVAGNLVRDPVLKYTPSGKPVAEFGVAVNRKKGEDKVAHFFDVACFERTAETVAQYLHKGDPVAFEGYMEQQRWETQDGQKRSKVALVATRIHFLPSNKQGQGEAGSYQEGDEVN